MGNYGNISLEMLKKVHQQQILLLIKKLAGVVLGVTTHIYTEKKGLKVWKQVWERMHIIFFMNLEDYLEHPDLSISRNPEYLYQKIKHAQ